MPPTTDEITKLVSKLACESCKLDPIPTHLLKANLSSLAPVIADIVNVSNATSRTIVRCQTCALCQKSQRRSLVSVSLNICQTTIYMSKCNLLIVHSTETALLRVRDDLLCILDERNAAILVLLDLSAAFDMIDHTIMLTHLRDRFGITAI